MSNMSAFPWLSDSRVFSKLSKQLHRRFDLDWELADGLLRNVERYLDERSSYDAWVHDCEEQFEAWREEHNGVQ